VALADKRGGDEGVLGGDARQGSQVKQRDQVKLNRLNRHPKLQDEVDLVGHVLCLG